MTKQVIGSLSSFEHIKSKFIEWGDHFVVKKFGSCREIYLKHSDGHIKKMNVKFMDIKSQKKGMHICWMVRRDIQNRILSGEYIKKQYPERHMPPTIFYNEKHIRKNIGKVAVALDISNCYFITLLLTSAISERVYKLGNKKDREWKEGRTTSVGSLGRKISFETYNPSDACYAQGKPSDTRPLPDDLRTVRIEVIEKVAEVAQKVFEACYDGWMMYLTDCFYLLPEYVDTAKAILAEHGYDTKEKQVIFKSLKQVGAVIDKVAWDDVKEKETTKKKKKTELPNGMRPMSKPDKEDDHYHFFNSTQNQFIIP